MTGSGWWLRALWAHLYRTGFDGPAGPCPPWGGNDPWHHPLLRGQDPLAGAL